jgi:phosphodiester glycosidase
MRLIGGTILGLAFLFSGHQSESRPVHAQLPAQVWEKSIAPGLIYRMEYDPNLPRTLHAVRISPQSPSVRFAPELAGKTINEDGGLKGRWTPTDIASQAGAIVAVNGDFFSYDHGAPIGEMVRAGELITTPSKARATFAWGPRDERVAMANAQAWVTFQSGQGAKLDAINQPLNANGIVLYTPAEGQVQPPAANVTVVLSVPAGSFSPSTTATATVESLVSDETKTVVPAGHALLIATGEHEEQLASLRQGDTVSIRTATEGMDWEKYENLIGGGPFLVRDGAISVDADEEGFNADFQLRHPRSAIGKTADGDVWIVTIDGRQACSVGATLVELARVMRRLGCTDAINLDGGGSTALNMLGLTVSRPADGVERAVVNGVLVFGPRPTAPEGTLSLRLAPLADGTVQATVLREGHPVANAEAIWSARGAAWVDEGGLLHPVHSGHVHVAARALGVPVEADVVVHSVGPEPKKIAPADK